MSEHCPGCYGDHLPNATDDALIAKLLVALKWARNVVEDEAGAVAFDPECYANRALAEIDDAIKAAEERA